LNGTLAAITDPVVFRAVDVTANEYWVTGTSGFSGFSGTSGFSGEGS
jgi:hypothetical protein